MNKVQYSTLPTCSQASTVLVDKLLRVNCPVPISELFPQYQEFFPSISTVLGNPDQKNKIKVQCRKHAILDKNVLVLGIFFFSLYLEVHP